MPSCSKGGQCFKICWINLYPVDNTIIIVFCNTYPLHRDSSSGQRYLTFEQPGPDKRVDKYQPGEVIICVIHCVGNLHAGVSYFLCSVCSQKDCTLIFPVTSWLHRLTLECTCTPLTKSERKERACSLATQQIRDVYLKTSGYRIIYLFNN